MYTAIHFGIFVSPKSLPLIKLEKIFYIQNVRWQYFNLPMLFCSLFTSWSGKNSRYSTVKKFVQSVIKCVAVLKIHSSS
jgi:hypothetical protein